MDASRFIDAYATTFQTTHGNLILVQHDINMTHYYDVYYYNVLAKQDMFSPYNYLYSNPPNADPYKWMCARNKLNHECAYFLPEFQREAANNSWSVQGLEVKYYLVEKSLAHCRLQFSLPLGLMIVGVNLIKVVIMGYMTVSTTETPILITGDTITSFTRPVHPRLMFTLLVSCQTNFII